MSLGFFLLFLACAWVFVGDQLRLLVFPQELDALIETLEQGSGLSEAITAFCQGILDGQ